MTTGGCERSFWHTSHQSEQLNTIPEHVIMFEVLKVTQVSDGGHYGKRKASDRLKELDVCGKIVDAVQGNV